MAIEASTQKVIESGSEGEVTGGTYAAWDDIEPSYQPEGPTPVDTTQTPSPDKEIPTAETTVEPTTITKASTPYRELQIGNSTIDADYDINVRGGETGAKNATIRLWNIDSVTWKQIVHGTPIRIKAGWRHTRNRTIFSGFARDKRREHIRRDNAFTINAAADSYTKLSTGYSGSWNNTSPHRIADRIAAKAGFDKGYISHTSEPIDSWTMSSHRELEYWLEKLAKDAGKAASSSKHSDPWAWYTTGNKLYFHSRVTQPETPKLLEAGSTLLRAAPTTTADGKDIDDHAEVSFDCRFEPWVDRGSVVKFKGVDIDEDRLYRVKSIEYETSTTRGRHHVHGKCSPVRVVEDSRVREHGALPPQRPEKDRVFHSTTPSRRE